MQISLLGGKLLTHVATYGELDVLAKVDQMIFNILNDTDVGRAKASQLLAEKGFGVSEKLIRTWRDKIRHGLVNPITYQISAQPEHGIVTNHTNYVKPVPMPIWEPPLVHNPPVATFTFNSIPQKAYRIVVMPDVQAPLHDEALVRKFVKFLGDYQPDELAQVGDFTDSTEISRWVRGKKQEFAGDLQAGFDSAQSILADIRNVFSGRFRIVRSNHDDRLELYIAGCAPGLNFRDLTFEHQMRFSNYGVEFIRDEVVELAPGWVMAHGDEGSLSPSAGKTAFGLAKNKFGVSTVCGHTHRAGMTSESTGYNGKIRNTLTGLEVGHFMDLTKADYLKKKGVAANWQQAFGILEVYGDRVYPRLITVQDGYFSVEGVLY
jgi:hypothetical protein